MASVRRSVQDFIAAVNAQTPGSVSSAVYAATLQGDGSVQITKNGVILFPHVLWAMGVGGAVTDVSTFGDTVTILRNDGTVARGDAQQFINSLT